MGRIQWEVLLVVGLVGLVVRSGASVSLSEQIPEEPRRILDAYGRELFVHGTNVVVKGPPYFPIIDTFDVDLSFSRRDFEMMSTLGLNGVRLGVMWPGVFPQDRGVVNKTYIGQVLAFLELAGEFDVYVLVDMHQDVLSPAYCGEGIPEWAAAMLPGGIPVFDFPVPLQKTPFLRQNELGFPTRSECQKHTWSNYYGTIRCSEAYESLYNDPDLLESWGEFWTTVVTATLSTEAGRSQILGFELINEPWVGNFFAEPKLIIPGVADKANLQPAYDSLSTHVRTAAVEAEAPQPLVFFAAVTFDDIVPAGFTHAPGGTAYSNQSVFAYHFYVPPQSHKPALEQLYFDTRVADATRLATGQFLTEFERPSLESPIESDPYCNVTRSAEQHLAGHLFWEWKTFCRETNETESSDNIWAAFGACITGYGQRLIFNQDGSVNQLPMMKLARTYARHVSGLTVTNEFDAVSRVYSLTFETRPGPKPTEVFVSTSLVYPEGYSMKHDAKVTVITRSYATEFGSYDVLELHTASDSAGDIVSFTITP